MTAYSIIYLDNYHCLKCGSRSDSLKSLNLAYKVSGISVKGSALLCKPCTAIAKQSKPDTVRDIIGETAVIDMLTNDQSPYCEVMDAEYFDRIERPAAQESKNRYSRPSMAVR